MNAAPEDLTSGPGRVMFKCQGVCKSYSTRNGALAVLDNVTFQVYEQEFVCVVGPSGCGKTTLLKMIAGLLKPSSGTLEFTGPPPDGRPRAAMVFQDHGLFPWMTLIENVAFGLEMQGVAKRERVDRSRAFVDKVGLTPFAGSYPHELSVGMRQRVGIARSFVTDSPVLLMDEPLSSVDAQTRRLVQEEILRLWRDHRKSVIYITHDIEEAVVLGDRLLVMSGRPSRIREEIPIRLDRPRDLSINGSKEMAAIMHHVWEILEDEVRKTLWIPK